MMLLAAEAAGGGQDWLPVVVPAILTLFTGGGLVAVMRARPEGSKLIVDAAQGAVVVQAGVIDSLREELAEARREIEDLRKSFAEVAGLRSRVRELEHENELLRSENAALSARLREVEMKTS